MKKKLQEKKKLLSYLGGVFLLLFLIFLGYHLAYWQRIYPGVTIANKPVGNKTKTEAIIALEEQLTEIEVNNIALVYDDLQWEINLTEPDFAYEATTTAEKAFQVGRSGHPTRDLQSKTQAWFSGLNLGWKYRLDQNLLESQIATIAAQIFIPTIEPRIEIINQEVGVEQGKEGQELDKSELISMINHQLSTLNFDPIQLPVIHLSLLLTEEQMDNTRQRGEKFLNKKLTFIFEETSWELEAKDLVGFLSFTDGFDQEKIASQAASLASTIDRSPQNAAFQFEGGKVTQFRPAAEGRALEQEEVQKLIQAALKKIENEGKEEETIHLPVTTAPPAIMIGDVNDLGIKELLGEGISYFWGSIPSRIHNIVLASSALNGVLIPPGAIFSLNETLGDVSPATGYQTAFIIKEGKTILGDGGGVCQVSTTLFRAALNTGLPIIERYPHSYRVNYYEQGGFGPGLDATVWIPGVDLKFKNDTPTYILIQANADTKTMTLTFEFYGTSDGRQITVSKPKVWNQTPPPPDLYQDDPTLPAGTVKRIERAVWGAKASVDWKVTRGDEVLQERTFYSAYQPWQAVYLRGTGQ